MKSKLNIFFKMVLLMSFFSISWAETKEVFVATKNIKFKEKVGKNNTVIRTFTTKIKCEPLSVSEFEKGDFRTTHFIFKDSVLCVEDVQKYEKESVVFDFGNFEIEKEGKILFENDEYLRIKKEDGEVEKIYKDGRIN